MFGMPGAGRQRSQARKPMLLVAACALIDIDGRVLLARRPEGKKMAGLWEFPGGKLHPGETPEAALIRELKEELGIDVSAACLAPFAFASHAYERFHLLMPLYLCRRWKGIADAAREPDAGLGAPRAVAGLRGAAGRQAADSPAARFPLKESMTMAATNPTACLLVIGNEVLSGRTQDANIRFLAIGLGELGIPLREVRVIPDVPQTIIDTVNEVRAKFDYVFTTGGIGPTHDDITSECVAAAFGVPWEPHPVAWARMESVSARRIQRRAAAHGDDAARRDADRQRAVGRARFPDRQRLRDGGRAARHAVDVRMAGAAPARRPEDRVARGARDRPCRRA